MNATRGDVAAIEKRVATIERALETVAEASAYGH